jgi:hypothetical protein
LKPKEVDSVGGTRSARLLRRGLLASVIAASGMIAAAPMAAADPCPPLDLGCVIQDTTTTAGGVVEDTTTTVGGVVEDTTTTVGGVVEDTTTTVGGVLDGDGPPDPTPIVDGVLPVGIVPDGIVPDSGGALPDGGETTGGDPTPGGGGNPTGGSTQVGQASSDTPGGPTRIARDPGAGSLAPAPAGDASTTVGHPFPSFLDDGSNGALISGARLVRTFAFPLMLILLVIGFVFVQNRIDRKDPKLALAPVGSDYLTFS